MQRLVWVLSSSICATMNNAMQGALDEGALLHGIPWLKGATWDSICRQYTSYVKRKYGKATVVFDGYLEGPTPTDCAPTKQSGGCVGAEIHFTSSMFKDQKRTVPL